MSPRSEVQRPALRVVFDTNTVVSALLFASGDLAWLRQHWREGGLHPSRLSRHRRGTHAGSRLSQIPPIARRPHRVVRRLSSLLRDNQAFREMPDRMPGPERSTIPRSCPDRQRRSARHRRPRLLCINRSNFLSHRDSASLLEENPRRRTGFMRVHMQEGPHRFFNALQGVPGEFAAQGSIDTQAPAKASTSRSIVLFNSSRAFERSCIC